MLTGTNLNFVTEVDFGSSFASNFWINSPTSITAYSPRAGLQASNTPAVDISVKSPYGVSPNTVADQFRFQNPTPSVTGITAAIDPANGMTAFTISGTKYITTECRDTATAACGIGRLYSIRYRGKRCVFVGRYAARHDTGNHPGDGSASVRHRQI